MSITINNHRVTIGDVAGTMHPYFTPGYRPAWIDGEYIGEFPSEESAIDTATMILRATGVLQ